MSAPNDIPLVELRDVHKTYRMDGVDVRALCGISFTVAAGQYACIMGPSGCGKSTLLNLIGCLDRPTSGAVRLAGHDTAKLTEPELASLRNRSVGFVFQSYNLLPRAAALTNVALPMVYARVPPGERRRRAAQLLKRVGLEGRGSHLPSQLSGGEQQRVAIARALVNRPQVLLADEPTGNLDSRSGADILTLLDDLHRQGLTILMVSHDQAVADRAQRILRLADGMLVEDTGPTTGRGG